MDSTIQAALALIVRPSIGASEDEVYGSNERRKVSDTWPVNLDPLMKQWKTKPGGAAGTATLIGTTEVGGKKCIEVGYKVDDGKLSLPLKAGHKVYESTGKTEYRATLPMDNVTPRLTETERSETTTVEEGTQRNSGIEFEFKIKTTVTNTFEAKYKY